MVHVLIIEDNDFDCDMLSRRFVRCGFTVSSATNGKQGIDKAVELHPDIIIMDMGLPILDGWEATRIIKSNLAILSIPIIAVTAHALTEDKQRCLDAGCNAYEPKPLDFSKLLAIVNQLLSPKDTV